MNKKSKYPWFLVLVFVLLISACAPIVAPWDGSVRRAEATAWELNQGATATAIVAAAQGTPLAATSAPQAPFAPVATSAPGLNTEGFVGPTTAEAKVAIGIDVQRLRTEPSAFVWRGSPKSTFGKCPTRDWVCTMHLVTDDVKLFTGDGTNYNIIAGTWRFVKGYAPTDAVNQNPPCQLLAKEQDFGAKEIPSFPVYPGNFNCPTSKAAVVTTTLRAPAPTSVAVLPCPTFGGVQTTPGNDGSPYCKYKGSTVSDLVPAGYKAEYWDGSQTKFAVAGDKVNVSEATFRRP